MTFLQANSLVSAVALIVARLDRPRMRAYGVCSALLCLQNEAQKSVLGLSMITCRPMSCPLTLHSQMNRLVPGLSLRAKGGVCTACMPKKLSFQVCMVVVAPSRWPRSLESVCGTRTSGSTERPPVTGLPLDSPPFLAYCRGDMLLCICSQQSRMQTKSQVPCGGQ